MARYDPCICCPSSSSSSSSGGGKQCCALADTATYPFTPEAGFDLLLAEVTNGNKNDCVGKAILEIELFKAADCPPSCIGGCADLFVDGDFCHGSIAGLLAVFNELLGVLESMALPFGWMFNPLTSTGYYYYDPMTCELDSGASTSPYYTNCSSGYSTSITQPTFIMELGTPMCDCDYYVLFDYADEKLLDLEDLLSLLVGWQKLIKCGSKLYCLTFTDGFFYYSGMGCMTYASGEWCMEDIRASHPVLFFDVTCLDMSTDVPDYPWPADLTCECSGHFDPTKEITSEPACKLTKMETSIDFDETTKTYRFKATYKGRLEAEYIDCSPGNTDPDCICCGEV
jgi:hypothetical protein